MTTTNKTFSAFTLLVLIVIIIFLLLKKCSGDTSSTSNDYNEGEESKKYTEKIDSLEGEDIRTGEDIVVVSEEESENNTQTKPLKKNKLSKMGEGENGEVVIDKYDSPNSSSISANTIIEKPKKKKGQGDNSTANPLIKVTKPPIKISPKLNTRGGASNSSPSNSQKLPLPPPPPKTFPSPKPKKLPPPYDYNKKNLAEDLMKCTPSMISKPLPEFRKRLQYSSALNLIISGEFADGTDEYKLKNYISHLRNTGPYDIEVFDIKKDKEGRMVAIKLKETQVNSNRPKYDSPKRKALTSSQPQRLTPYNYSEKSLAADFMKLDPNLRSSQIVKLKERIYGAFTPNAIISGEFSDGTTQYKLKNYIAHLRTTGPYIVDIHNMEKDKEGKVVSIRLRETQVD